MNALFFSFLASGCAALANLFFRKSTGDSAKSENSNGYLLIYFLFSFLFSLFISEEIWKGSVNYTVIAFGASVGLLNMVLMVLTANALKKGPSGLTFAFQNASSVFPGMLLFMVFGAEFGYALTFSQIAGMGLVLLGLFLGARGSGNSKVSLKWLQFALGCLLVQILALTLMQGRCIFMDCDKLGDFLTPFSFTEADDKWFMPAQFGTALLCQTCVVLFEKKGIRRKEIFYGSLAGLANGASTCLLLLATIIAMPFEKAILFPCFAVSAIVLCNLWAFKLYGEKPNIPANLTCVLGVFIGSIG